MTIVNCRNLIVLLIIVIIIISLYFFLKSNNKVKETYEKIGQVTRFVNNPNEQKYCPHMPNSKTAFWVQLPKQDNNEGYFAKFCCTGCYSVITDGITTDNGDYKISILNNEHIKKLKEYSKKNKINKFKKKEMEKYINKVILTIKHGNNGYFPIQLLKKRNEIEDNQAINTQLYEEYLSNK